LPIAPGEDTARRRSARERCFEAAGEEASKGTLAATGVMEAMVDAAIAGTLGCRAPACSRGCHWCCHVYVTVTAPEAIVATRWAIAHAPPEEIEALRARLRANAGAARGKTPAEYPRQTCAFNVGGVCSIYEARPGHCRSAHSFDVDACRAAYEARPDRDRPVPALRDVHLAATEVRTGYLEALVHARAGRHVYELQQVSALLLDEPSAADRWLEGDRGALDSAMYVPTKPPLPGGSGG